MGGGRGVPGLRFWGGKGGGGGYLVSDFQEGGGRGVPGLRFLGGYLVSDFFGGVPGLRFSGGYLVSDFRGGTWSQIFRGGYPVLVKGKNFDSRFGLIHVQTGKNNFC